MLAGGVGSRFWPVSTAERPKQLLALAGPHSLLVETVERIRPLVSADRVLVVTSRHLGPAVREALPEIPAHHILTESRAASTAPAVAWATALAAQADPEASVVSLHADWTVADAQAFQAVAAQALETAEREDVLVTVGVRPSRADLGYGYIVPGEQISSSVRRVSQFVEKPTADHAAELLAHGALWNSGLFAWTARRFRAEAEAHAPEIATAFPALDRGDAEAFYDAVTAVSVDVGILERSKRVAVVEGEYGWDDVGSWLALRRVRASDAGGNVVVGAAHLVDSTDCIVWSDDGVTVVDGVHDLVVVRSRGITLVTTAARASELKRLLAQLPPELAGDLGA